MHEKEQTSRIWNLGEVNGRKLQTIKKGEKWHWLWGDWLSPGFTYLENRPWTLLVIGGKLCFSVKENDKWFVVWGDQPGKIYDDVYDTKAFSDKPLYIARQDMEF